MLSVHLSNGMSELCEYTHTQNYMCTHTHSHTQNYVYTHTPTHRIMCTHTRTHTRVKSNWVEILLNYTVPGKL